MDTSAHTGSDKAVWAAVDTAAAVADPVSFEEQERVEYVPSARSTMDAEQLGLQHSSGLQCSVSQQSVQEQQQLPLQSSAHGPELTDLPAAEESSAAQADAAASAALPESSPTAVHPAPEAPESPAALPAGLRVHVISDADCDCPGELKSAALPSRGYPCCCCCLTEHTVCSMVCLPDFTHTSSTCCC